MYTSPESRVAVALNLEARFRGLSFLTGLRLLVAVAAPVTILVAPGPMEDVQAKARKRLFIFEQATALCAKACSLRGK